MEFLYLSILSALSVVLIFFAFKIGLYYGAKIKNDELIDKPKINPIKIVKEQFDDFKDENKLKIKQQIEETNLYNIDNYDGTGMGQKEIPR